MTYIDGPPVSHEVSGRQPEYSGVVSSRHGAALHVSGRKLRLAYFGVASAWGFLVGVGALFAALQAGGQLAALPGAELLVYLVPFLVIALGGGMVIAGAYQEVKRRR